MRKFILSTIMVLMLSVAMVGLLTSCSTLFNRPSGAAGVDVYTKKVVYKTIASNPVDAESHYLMGCQFQKEKKHAWAIDEFQTALEKNPAHVEAYNRLGVSYDLTGDFGRALDAYQAALRIDPNLDYVHNNLGYSYLLQERYDLAVASFQQAIALNPENNRYRNNLATAYAKTGRDEAAIAALEVEADEVSAHVKLARVYYRDGAFEKAKAYFARAAELKPEDSETDDGLAAAGNMADIHTGTTAVDQGRQEAEIQTAKVVPNRFDEDGFYTVPAVPVADFADIEVVDVDTTPSEADVDPAVEESPYYLASIVPGALLEDEAATAGSPVEMLARQLVEETELRRLAGDEFNGIESGGHARVLIEVANGNGVRHMARQVGDYLRDQTLVLMYLTNADHFHYDRTSIAYTRGNLAQALRVAEKLPGSQQMQEKETIREGHADISVRIGKDLIPHLETLKES